MALRSVSKYLVAVLAVIGAAGLFVQIQQHMAQERYNNAIATGDYAEAAKFEGVYGQFAEAFQRELDGETDNARAIYGNLGRSGNAALQTASLYNLGNSYMKQALALDIDTDADRALPLIELAKSSYRQSLAVDSENWDARRNLQMALLLVPDANPKVPMEVQGRRGAIRTVISADTEKNYP